MQVELHSLAERDLIEAFHFYEHQDSDLGAYFLDSIFADLDSLAFYAGFHRKVFGFHRLLAKRFPYAIYYRIESQRVLVFRILDCRRSPQVHRDGLKSG